MLRPSLSPLALQEEQDSRDMQEHARRLALFSDRIKGKVWQRQPNGEVWLVDCYDGTTGMPSEPSVA